jgi:hypothetical protein
LGRMVNVKQLVRLKYLSILNLSDHNIPVKLFAKLLTLAG